MEREAKAKVVGSVWGADFVQFLAALDVLPRSIWRNRMNLTVSLPTVFTVHIWTTNYPSAEKIALFLFRWPFTQYTRGYLFLFGGGGGVKFQVIYTSPCSF